MNSNTAVVAITVDDGEPGKPPPQSRSRPVPAVFLYLLASFLLLGAISISAFNSEVSSGLGWETPLPSEPTIQDLHSFAKQAITNNLERPTAGKEMEKPQILCTARRSLDMRHCKHGRVNYILYDHHYPSGLNHQRSVISRFVSMSRLLCATVYTPKPCRMLHWDQHNHNKSLKCDYYWDRYFDLESPITPGLKVLKDAETFANDTKGLPVLHVALNITPNEAERQYALLEKYYETQQPFVWRVSPSYWNHVIQHILKKFLDCHAVTILSLKPSHIIKDLAANFSKYLKLDTSKNFTALHIRRGDAMESCNSTVENVVGYVKCSSRGARISTLVIFTNEQDPKYLKKLKAGLLTVVGRVVYADSEVVEAVQAGIAANPQEKAVLDDNFLLFALGKHFQYLASRTLWLNRLSCDLKCSNPNAAQEVNANVWY